MNNTAIAFAVLTLVTVIVTAVAYFKSMSAYAKADWAKTATWAGVAFCGGSLMVVLRSALAISQRTPSAIIFIALWGFVTVMSYLRLKVSRQELAKKPPGPVDPGTDKG